MSISESYSAASVLPAKLVKLKYLCVDENNFIRPVHVQICPTNQCNLSCSFCSCVNRDRNQALNISELSKAIDIFTDLGMRAITITGGGEPCCYPDLGKLLWKLKENNIESGLVTNGLLLHNFLDTLTTLTWCRVSVSDDRNIDELLKILEAIVPVVPIDWAFSYVITAQFDLFKFSRIVRFANEHNFTHVRAVSDLLDLDHVPSMEKIKNGLWGIGVDDSRVLYQDRQEYTSGVKDCRISLLKPVLAPDGWLYPCCGVQYAMPETTGRFPEQMRMCRVSDIEKYYTGQTIFNGGICDKCYYDNYNMLLGLMSGLYDHEVFV